MVDESLCNKDIRLEHLDQEYLKKILSFDPFTGIFVWLKRLARKMFEGDAAGTKNKDGYIVITIHTKRYYAHRLAWLYMTGEWPSDQVDHRNCIKNDNRWDNLRLADTQKNTVNRGLTRANTSGCKGVSWDVARGKWAARIKVGDSNKFLGRFDSKEDAAQAYAVVSRQYHGEFSRLA